MTDETKQYAVGDVVEWRSGVQSRRGLSYLLIVDEPFSHTFRYLCSSGSGFADPSDLGAIITPAAGAPLRYCRWRFEGSKEGDWVSCGGTPRRVVRANQDMCTVELDSVRNAVMNWDLVGDIVPAPKLDARGTLAEQIAKAISGKTISGKLEPRPKSCHHTLASGPCADCELIESRQAYARQTKLTLCSECRAPLRAEQIKRDGMCAYCATRIGAIGHATCAELANRFGTIDYRIALTKDEPEPRAAHDWDVFVTPGSDWP